MTAPYYADDHVTLYHGDWRDHSDGLTGDVIITDPPYGETDFTWDTWPNNWPELAHPVAPAMWCFGSFRMFLEQRDQFRHWKYSHEIVWAKDRGTSIARDKFARSHEYVTLWYHGPWAEIHHTVPRVPSTVPHRGHRNHGSVPHMNLYVEGVWEDDGTRMQTTIIPVKHELRRAIHPTQKPLGIITPLIQYSTDLGDTVIDLYSGSGSIALAARQAGRKCVAFEISEAHCEAAANRLGQADLDFGDWDGAA